MNLMDPETNYNVMRRIIIPLFFILGYIVTGCDTTKQSQDEDPVKEIIFSIDRYSVGDGLDEESTKTTMAEDGTFLWSAGDTVGIYPNTGAQVYFELSEGQGATSAVFDGGGWEFKASATYYSYYPFIGDIYLDRRKIPVSYVGQKQIGVSNTSGIGPFDFMYTPGTSSESGNLHFAYSHLNCIMRFRLTLPAGEYIRLAVSSTEAIFVKSGYYDLMSDSPAIVPVNYTNELFIDLENVTSDGSEIRVFMMSAPVNIVGKEWIVSVWDKEKKEYQCPKSTSKVFEAGNIYGFTCSSWTEVPQSVGFSMQGWDAGSSIGGAAE